MEDQLQFLRALRNNIKKKSYVKACLWSASYSHMKLTISYLNKNDFNESEIIEFIKKTMTTPVFVRLMNENFKKDLKVENYDDEMIIIWERERDRYHPHGKVKIFVSGGGVSYGTDEAGSTWCSSFGTSTWKLHSYKE